MNSPFPSNCWSLKGWGIWQFQCIDSHISLSNSAWAKCDFIAKKVPVGSIHSYSIEMKRVFLFTLGDGPTSPIVKSVMSMSMRTFHGGFKSTARNPCSPTVAYVSPSVLQGVTFNCPNGPTQVQRERVTFPSHTQVKHWKCRDSNPDHLTRCSRLFFSTPNSWHKQQFMCYSLISCCLLHFIKSLPCVLGTMRDYTIKANLLIRTCHVKSWGG